MKTALIGYTGFVGSTLNAAVKPTHCYRSTTIDEIRGEEFDHVICAGVQAMKWWANLHPEEDMAGIQRLLDALSEVKAERITLISSIDVYPAPREVDENSFINKEGHHPYGLHRLHVEEWVREHFANVAILRLPGLFGPGLKKNVIYDMMHDNGLEKVHPDGVFQYYDTRQLSGDIEKVWNLDISLLNVATEPIATSEIRNRFYPGKILGGTGSAPPGYDMHSVHAVEFGAQNGYLYSKNQVLEQMSDWLAQEI
jgi:NAD dependent epimerase/dehydratase family